MQDFIRRIMNAANKYTALDFGFLKILLFSAGILVCTYYVQFFMSIRGLLWIVFSVSFVWIMYRTFFKHMG